MNKFIKDNKKTITFIAIVLVIVGIIFIYRYVTINIGVYEPSHEPAKIEIRKFNANEYNVVTIDKEIVYRSYYKYFINLLINNPVKAYDMLTNETKENLFDNEYNKFSDYVKKLNKSVLLKADISRYNDEKNRIIIVDNTESSYTFYEKGTWNFTVGLNR